MFNIFRDISLFAVKADTDTYIDVDMPVLIPHFSFSSGAGDNLCVYMLVYVVAFADSVNGMHRTKDHYSSTMLPQQEQSPSFKVVSGSNLTN